MDRQGRDALCFLWVVSRTMARMRGGAAGASWGCGDFTAPSRLWSSPSKLPLVPGPGAHLHIPVQADGREKQALHVLKGDGALLLIVDEKC